MDPFIRSVPAASMHKVRLALRQTGVSQTGARQFLDGLQVSSPADRLLLAQLLVEAVGDAAPKPAEFKPAEFKPAEFRRTRR